MAKKTGKGFIFLAIVLILFAFERIAMYFFLPNKLNQILFLDSFWVISAFILLFLFFYALVRKKTEIIKNAIIPIIGEDKSIGEFLGSVLIGIWMGLAFSLFAFSGTLASITDLFGGEYQPLSSIGKLNALRFAVVGDELSPARHFVLSAALEVMHVAFSEEILMATVTALILAGLGMSLKADSAAELLDPKAPAALGLRGTLFSFLHFIAYTGGLRSFSIGYFIPAFLGGVFFGGLLLWRGLIAVIFAHGTYNVILGIMQATGMSLLGPLIIAVVVLGILVRFVVLRKLRR